METKEHVIKMDGNAQPPKENKEKVSKLQAVHGGMEDHQQGGLHD